MRAMTKKMTAYLSMGSVSGAAARGRSDGVQAERYAPRGRGPVSAG